MNKQAITFLSLFSLILVLSVYYILLPPLEYSDLPVTITTEQTSEVAMMQDNLDQQRIEIIQQNNSIIASSSSDEIDIEVALQSIADTKNIVDQEKTISEIVQNAGYSEVFVEMQGSNIKIVIEKKDATSLDANTVIKLLMNEFGTQYHVEVKFVEG